MFNLKAQSPWKKSAFGTHRLAWRTDLNPLQHFLGWMDCSDKKPGLIAQHLCPTSVTFLGLSGSKSLQQASKALWTAFPWAGADSQHFHMDVIHWCQYSLVHKMKMDKYTLFLFLFFSFLIWLQRNIIFDPTGPSTSYKKKTTTHKAMLHSVTKTPDVVSKKQEMRLRLNRQFCTVQKNKMCGELFWAAHRLNWEPLYGTIQ